MPSSDRPPLSALDRPTRQQLDELDALMQRMLALPVNPADDLEALAQRPPPRERRPEKPSPAAEPRASLPTPVEARRPEQASPEPAVKLAVTFRKEPFPPPPPPVAPATESVPALPVAWPLRPLVWLNRLYDWLTSWLGPLGRWLRGPGGRGLLGWSGVLLLLAALAWVAWDTLGWTW